MRWRKYPVSPLLACPGVLQRVSPALCPGDLLQETFLDALIPIGSVGQLRQHCFHPGSRWPHNTLQVAVWLFVHLRIKYLHTKVILSFAN